MLTDGGINTTEGNVFKEKQPLRKNWENEEELFFRQKECKLEGHGMAG